VPRRVLPKLQPVDLLELGAGQRLGVGFLVGLGLLHRGLQQLNQRLLVVLLARGAHPPLAARPAGSNDVATP
jgi:hypothetical protein